MKYHIGIFVILAVFMLNTAVFGAQQQEPSTAFRVASFMPAPQGQYQNVDTDTLSTGRITLSESDLGNGLCSVFDEGEIILNNNTLYICNGTNWTSLTGGWDSTKQQEGSEDIVSLHPSSTYDASIDKVRLILGVAGSNLDIDDKASEFIIVSDDDDGATSISLRQRKLAGSVVYSVNSNELISAGVDLENAFSIYGGEHPKGGSYKAHTQLIGMADGKTAFPSNVSAFVPSGARVDIQKNMSMVDQSSGFNVNGKKAALALVLNDDRGSLVSNGDGVGMTFSVSEDSYPTAAIVAEKTGIDGKGNLHILTNNGSGSGFALDQNDHVMVLTDDNQVGIGVLDVAGDPFVTNDLLEVNGNIILTSDGGGNAQYKIKGVVTEDTDAPDTVASKKYVDDSRNENLSGACFTLHRSNYSSSSPYTDGGCQSEAGNPNMLNPKFECPAGTIPLAGPGGSAYVGAYKADGGGGVVSGNIICEFVCCFS